MSTNSKLDNTIGYVVPEEEFGKTIDGFGAVVGKTKTGHRLVVADTGIWIADEQQVFFNYAYIDREDNQVTLTDAEVVNLVTRIVENQPDLTIESIEKELFPTLRLMQKEQA